MQVWGDTTAQGNAVNDNNNDQQLQDRMDSTDRRLRCTVAALGGRERQRHTRDLRAGQQQIIITQKLRSPTKKDN